MVLFGIQNQKCTSSKRDSDNKDPYLVITTNEINNDIIKSIDTLTTKNIIFQVPLGVDVISRDITFDFTVDLWLWNIFIRDIEYLEFAGKLVKNQLNSKHFEEMTSLKGLSIGSTTYPLFDNEDISKLPMIRYVSLNGYGLVMTSENFEKWLEKLKLNNCEYSHCY